MQRFTLFCVVLSVCGAFACGCDSGGEKPTTAQEKKDFAGGPMPPDVRKKFEESMKQNNANRGNIVDKAKGAAGGGTPPGGGAPAPN